MHCPPPQGFYDKLMQMCIFPAGKSIYGHIFVNFSLNHGDMKKLCLDKIVGIILVLRNQNNALPSTQGFYDKLVQRCIFQAEKFIYGHIIVDFSLNHGDMTKRSLSIRLLVSSWSYLIKTMHCPHQQGFYDKLVQRRIFPAEKFIYGHIIVNFSLNPEDVKKISR